MYNLNDSTAYNSGKQPLTPQLYKGDQLVITIPARTLTNGVNYKYGVRLWQDYLDIVISKGIIQSIVNQTQFYIVPNINIKVGMSVGVGSESRTITAYNTVTSLVTISSSFSSTINNTTNYHIISDFIDQAPLENLYVRNTPQVYVTNVNNLAVKSYTFTGQYIQQQNVPIVSYTFNIWQVSKPENILLMSYSKESANIQCFYDGFLNGQDYLVELNITNEFNITVSTGKLAFSAVYATPPYLEKPQIEYIDNRNAFQVQFQSDNIIPVSTQEMGALVGYILKIVNNKQFVINQNLNIEIDDEIVINHYNKAKVVSYNRATGVLIIDGFKILPNLRDAFYINKKVNVGENGLNLLIDTPYRKVNSMELENSLIYSGSLVPGGIINDMPENFQYTMQLKFNGDFLNQIHNNKYNYTSLIDFDCDSYNCIGLHLGILNPNTLLALIPNGTEYNILNSETQTKDYVHLTNPIDFTKTQFLIFRDYNNYVAKIVTYNVATKGVTFEKPLPFTPQAGDTVWAPNSLTHVFGNIVTDEFVLRSTPDNLEHTAWIDSGNIWDDTKYWTETGAFRDLVAR